MWANTVWGFLGLSASCVLTILGLGPNSAVRSYLLFGAAIFFVACVLVLCWPLRKPDNRNKLREIFKHPIKRIPQLLEPSLIIILGLVIALGGVIWQIRRTPPEVASLKVEVANLRQSLSDAIKQNAPTTERDQMSAAPASRIIYTPTELSQTIDALGDLQPVLKNLTTALGNTEMGFLRYDMSNPSYYSTSMVIDIPSALSRDPEKAEVYRKSEIDRRLNARNSGLEALKLALDDSRKSSQKIFVDYPRMIRDVSVIFDAIESPKEVHLLIGNIQRYKEAIALSRNSSAPFSLLLAHNEIFLERLKPYRVKIDQQKANLDAKLSELRKYTP